jgi:hypothetical protein
MSWVGEQITEVKSRMTIQALGSLAERPEGASVAVNREPAALADLRFVPATPISLERNSEYCAALCTLARGHARLTHR